MIKTSSPVRFEFNPDAGYPVGCGIKEDAVDTVVFFGTFSSNGFMDQPGPRFTFEVDPIDGTWMVAFYNSNLLNGLQTFSKTEPDELLYCVCLQR